MTYSSQRRTLLLAAATAPLVLTVTACASSPAAGQDVSSATSFAALEHAAGGRLGVCAIDSASGRRAQHRADERFPFCSTFKAMLGAAVLAHSVDRPGLLQQRVTYGPSDLVNYSPVSGKHVGTGMTVAELCEAAIQYSDNSAANLAMKLIGGPSAVTAYARSIGDDAFRLDRWETELNTAIPGDLRDTSTPRAMGRDLQRLVLGHGLTASERRRLQDWMLGNTTGDARIRAGVPKDWKVADKTGTGDYAAANDVGVVWPPHCAPIVIAIYTTQHEKSAKARNDVIASAARIVVNAVR